MKFTISTSLLTLATFTTLSIATQVNIYDDQDCQNYQWSAYSSNWGCQAVGEPGSAKIADSGASCNSYSDDNCQNFLYKLSNPNCAQYLNVGTVNRVHSIACEY
jgi:hypothetical protein